MKETLTSTTCYENDALVDPLHLVYPLFVHNVMSLFGKCCLSAYRNFTGQCGIDRRMQYVLNMMTTILPWSESIDLLIPSRPPSKTMTKQGDTLPTAVACPRLPDYECTQATAKAMVRGSRCTNKIVEPAMVTTKTIPH